MKYMCWVIECFIFVERFFFLDEDEEEHEDDCNCPIPCHSVIYQSTVSYAASSNFDINALLKDPELTANLHERLVTSMELSQRLNSEEFE